MWNMYSLDGPRTNNNIEGWHSKIRKLACKAHLNDYGAVELFKAEQKATEVRHEKYEAGNYTLSELISESISNWVSF